MKISIITVTKNNKAGLLRAIESVRSQSYKYVEHIIVDGGSTDGTAEAIYNLQFTIYNLQLTIYNLQFVSEADSGIYDAINKGIKKATGDVIGLLHSDDFFADEFVLEKYAEAFVQGAKRQALSEVDAVYSDLVYVRSKTKDEKRKKDNSESTDHLTPARRGGSSIDHSELKIEHSVIRYWQAHPSSSLRMTNPTSLRQASHRDRQDDEQITTHYSLFTTHDLLNGWMPPHPTLFVRKEIFEKYGLYRTDMKIAADYEMILRLFYKYKITSYYLPLLLTV